MDKFDSLLIQKHHTLPAFKRTFWGVVTAGFWFVYFYLWAPLVTLLLWVVGIRTARFELYLRDHAVDPFLLTSLPVILLTATILLCGWAEYNRWRFACKERRLPADDIDATQVAVKMGATQKLSSQLANSKVLILHMDDHAIPISLTEVKISSPLAALARP